MSEKYVWGRAIAGILGNCLIMVRWECLESNASSI